MSARGSVSRRCPKPLEAVCAAGRCSHRWGYYVELPPDGDDRRRQLSKGGYLRKADAVAALDGARRQASEGADHRAGAQTVGDYLDEWLAGKVTLRATTRRSYEAHLRLYLRPHLGALRRRDLRHDHVQRAYQRIRHDAASTKRPLGPAGLQRVNATLQSALNAAVRRRVLAHNPARHVELETRRRPAVRPWEPDELGRFLDHAAGDRLAALYEVAAFTGLRRGELCGLRWCDVDLTRSVLVVRQQVVQLGHRTVLGLPKTKAGEHRVVDLDEHTVAALLAHQLGQQLVCEEWGEAYADWRRPFVQNPEWLTLPGGRFLPDCDRRGCTHDLVFAREDGTGLHPEYVTRHFHRLAKAAGLRQVRLHDLRHGQASLMLAAGVPLAVVSKRLGHSSLALTSDTYSHLLEGVGRSAAEAAASLVPRVPSKSLASDPADKAGTAPREVKAQVSRGGPPGDRTLNPRIKSPLLCQLS